MSEVAATLIAAVLLFVSHIYQTYKLSQVHTLVNSNFTEAKQARIAAELALEQARALNLELQRRNDFLERNK